MPSNEHTLRYLVTLIELDALAAKSADQWESAHHVTTEATLKAD